MPASPYLAGMIHLSEAVNILKAGAPADVEFVKKSTGQRVTMKQCILLSDSKVYGTMNLRSDESGQIRKIYKMLIVGINGQEVYY